MESYKHAYAKETVARWLRADPEKYFGRLHEGDLTFDPWDIVIEHPMALSRNNELKGLFKWDTVPPTYDWLLANAYLPITIFDIGVLHFMNLFCAIEIVHTNRPSRQKVEYLKRIGHEARHDLVVIEVDADWVLSRVKAPDRIQAMSKTVYGTVTA